MGGLLSIRGVGAENSKGMNTVHCHKYNKKVWEAYSESGHVVV